MVIGQYPMRTSGFDGFGGLLGWVSRQNLSVLVLKVLSELGVVIELKRTVE